VITREYSEQNKQFESKHNEIKTAEVNKREQIQSNFEEHITSITTQMAEE